MTIRDRDVHRELLRARLDRYRNGNVLRKIAMRITGTAPTARELELVRRSAIGGEGRVAEDVLRAVAESEPIWPMLAQKDLPEDLTIRELGRISTALRCAPMGTSDTDAVVSASLMFTDRTHLLMLRRHIPGDLLPQETTGYRYVTLLARGGHMPEPFVVVLRREPSGDNIVVATILVAATFLRYEQELGLLGEDAVERLETIVRTDLQEIVRTRQLLRDA
jgi:hypothetical protein